MLTVDEGEVLDRVERVYRVFMERAGLARLAQPGDRFWGAARS